VTREQLQAWLAAYERLWRTPGSGGLGEIFSEDASYSTAPFQEPIRGLAAIAEMWEAERLGPDEDFQLKREIVAVDGDTGVARIEVRYGPPREQLYRDLWVIVLGDGRRCTRFEEWPFWPPGSSGTTAGAGSG
jgi:hypothetical protein